MTRQRRAARLRLRHQVLLLMAAMLAVALSALYYVSSSRIAEAGRATGQVWAESLALTTARAIAEPMALKDYGALEATLRAIIALPGVRRIDVIDASDKPLLRVLKNAAPETAANAQRGVAAQLEYRPREDRVDLAQAQGARVPRLQDADVLQVWVPVDDRAALGRVGVTFSQEGERAALLRLQHESLLALAIIGVLAMLATNAFLLRALRPLQQLSEDSRNSDYRVRPGRAETAGSREVAELSEALDDASLRLRDQLDELRASEARTQTALAAAAERSARLNAVFDLSPDGFALFDRDERLVFCNPALLHMTGWDALAGAARPSLMEFDRHFSTLCGDEHPYVPMLGTASDAIAATLTLERPARRILARVFRRNLGGQGESILYFRDVTHESEVDRMKSEFLSSAAHEFRTPLASILGYSELMLGRDYDAAQRSELLEIINRQARLLTKLVDELLDLARIEARGASDFDFQLLSVDDVVASTVKAVVVPGAQRTLRVTTAAPLPQVRGDAGKLQQALSNVLSNAFKYSPAGGDVEIATMRRHGADEDRIGIAVRDHGIGMTAEQAGRAFERFYRADASGSVPGTGLGLALVKEILEIHGGSVDLASTPGQGTEVVLWLPVAGSS